VASDRLEGKVCILTGASSGIGNATAIGIAKLGATVVPVVRDLEQSRSSLEAIKSASGQSKVIPMTADLSSQSSIRELARQFHDKFDQLDVLVNNAGVFHSKRILTNDGIEATFAVNVLAPFLLTNLLLDRLKSSAPSRIVNVSSDAANGAEIDFQNLQGEKKYSTFGQYGQAKLALNLVTFEFSRRLAGSGVTANFLHPGVVRTNLARDLNPVARALFRFVQLFMASPKKGALTSIYVASSPDLEGVTGKYFARQREAKANPASFNVEDAERLWAICEELTGLKTADQVARPVRSI
jgi:NAD(P)-dependent dehydrogenase (short-subunit alcohol dehydrogenase family)